MHDLIWKVGPSDYASLNEIVFGYIRIEDWPGSVGFQEWSYSPNSRKLHTANFTLRDTTRTKASIESVQYIHWTFTPSPWKGTARTYHVEMQGCNPGEPLQVLRCIRLYSWQIDDFRAAWKKFVRLHPLNWGMVLPTFETSD